MGEVLHPNELVGLEVKVVAASYDSITLKLPDGREVFITAECVDCECFEGDDDECDCECETLLEYGVIEGGLRVG